MRNHVISGEGDLIYAPDHFNYALLFSTLMHPLLEGSHNESFCANSMHDESLVCSILTMLFTFVSFPSRSSNQKENQNKCCGVGGIFFFHLNIHSAFSSRAQDEPSRGFFDMRRKQGRLKRKHHSPHPIWGISLLPEELLRLRQCRRELRPLRRSACCGDSAGLTWAHCQVKTMSEQLLSTLSKLMLPFFLFSFPSNHFSLLRFIWINFTSSTVALLHENSKCVVNLINNFFNVQPTQQHLRWIRSRNSTTDARHFILDSFRWNTARTEK